jgi:hypothetical protein
MILAPKAESRNDRYLRTPAVGFLFTRGSLARSAPPDARRFVEQERADQRGRDRPRIEKGREARTGSFGPDAARRPPLSIFRAIARNRNGFRSRTCSALALLCCAIKCQASSVLDRVCHFVGGPCDHRLLLRAMNPKRPILDVNRRVSFIGCHLCSNNFQRKVIC